MLSLTDIRCRDGTLYCDMLQHPPAHPHKGHDDQFFELGDLLCNLVSASFVCKK